MVFGGLLAAGLSFIGASKDRKAQREANAQNRPAAQVAQWEEAQINPLFGISQGQYIPVQATRIGDAYSRAGGLIGQALDFHMEEKTEVTRLKQENKKLLERFDKLAKPRSRGYLERYSGVLPLPRQHNQGTQDANPLANNTRAGPADDGNTVVGDVAGNDLSFGGVKLPTQPDTTDAEIFEERYGEVGGAVLGLGVLGRDAYAAGRKIVKKLNLPKHTANVAELWRQYRSQNTETQKPQKKVDKRHAFDWSLEDYKRQLNAAEYRRSRGYVPRKFNNAQ